MTFLKAASRISRGEYVRRWEQAQRLLRQNSLVYPDLGDPAARRRPWELDGLPLIIPADEWRTVEASLKQRAKLLDLVLRDLYGPQTLVRDGILPPQILYRHPGFRLPFCRGPGAPDTRMLEFYAADLARAPDGRWFCFEVNPSPGFTYYESHTGQPIAAAIADMLIAADRGAPPWS
jgi:uncharacterized circularly permuted ATP-grasp superfamily protein